MSQRKKVVKSVSEAIEETVNATPIPLYKSFVVSEETGFGGVGDLTEIADSDLASKSHYVIGERGEVLDPSKIRMFKLQNVDLRCVVDMTNQHAKKTFNWVPKNVVSQKMRLPISIAPDYAFKFDNWYTSAFPNRPYKNSADFSNDNFKEPTCCKPYKYEELTNSFTMRVDIDQTCDVVIGGQQKKFGDLALGEYLNKKADVYIWVSDVWMMNNCYGYSFKIVNISIHQ